MLVVCWCFFFKQKTSYEMRISYWSSDVCSSDLHLGNGLAPLGRLAEALHLGGNDIDFLVVRQVVQRRHDRPAVHLRLVDLLRAVIKPGRIAQKNGRASCRERGCQYE